PGQMKLLYVLEGKVALHYNGGTHPLEVGDSAYLDGGSPPGWENTGSKRAKVLGAILGGWERTHDGADANDRGLPDRAVPVPALEALDRRAGGHAPDGRERGRRPRARRAAARH